MIAVGGQWRGVEITVFGMPAPQGSKRFVGRGAEGKGVMIESSAAVGPWRDDVARAAREVMGERLPLQGPLVLTVTFTLARPSYAAQFTRGGKPRRRYWPTTKPDLSKLVRSTEDALTEARVWKDDARVVDIVCRKRYENDPGAMSRPGAQIAVIVIDESLAAL